MEDFVSLAVAADQFDMTEDELYGLVRDGTVVGTQNQHNEGGAADWMVDRASLAEFRRGDPDATRK